MSGLERIICLDAHIPDKLMEVKVAEHANLSGTNGAGKTTLLKLVPFFYGASPGQVVQKVGKRKTFVDYYLPRPTSLIIFEYRTQRGLTCAVVFRHSSGDKPAYRFLGEPFNVEYFSEPRNGDRVYVDGKSLGRHWSMLQLEHSKQLENVTDYRAVIQGDRGLINRSGQSKELTPLVAMYSIAGSVGGMRYIDKMANAILGRSGDMDRIKEMLADIMREDGIALPQIQLHKNVREEMAGLAILRDLELHTDFFEDVVSKGESYAQNAKQQDVLSAELKQSEVILSQKITQTEAQWSALNEEMEIMKAQWTSSEFELSSILTKAQSDHEFSVNQLQRLFDEKGEWENQDVAIAVKVQEYQSRERYQRALDDEQERLDALEVKVKDISAQFKERKYKEIERHNQSCQEIREGIAALNKALAESVAQWQAKELSLAKKVSAEKESIRHERQEALDAQTQQIEATRLQANNALPTEEEKLDLREAEDARELAAENHLVAATRRETSLSEVEKLRSVANAADMQLAKSRRAREREAQERERLLKLCCPETGSLLSELREKDPTWHDSIGRLMRPELLERKDLSPIYLADSGADRTLLGWSLDLYKLEKPAWASSLEHQEDLLQQQEDQLDLAEKHEGDCQNKLKQAADDLQRSKLALDEVERLVTQAAQRQRAAVDAVRSVKLRNEEAADERKLAARAKLSRLESEKNQAIKDLNGEIKAAEERYESAYNEAMGIAKLEETRIQQDIDQNEDALADENKNHKLALSNLASDLAALCSERGLDESVLAKVKANISQAKERLRLALSYKSAVTRYNEWLADKWSQKAVYTERMELAADALNAAESTLTQTKNAYRHQRDEKAAERTKIESIKRDLRADLIDCKDMLTKMPPPISQITIELSRSLVMLIADCKAILDEQQLLRGGIIEGIRRAEGIICKSGDDNEIVQAWSLLRKREIDKLRDPDDIDALNMNLTLALRELMSVHLPQLREGSAAFVETIAGQLTDFYIRLKGVSGAIKNQSRQISNAICSTMHFDAISDIQVALISRIDSQDYWPVLEEFYHLWQEWKENSAGDLPPKEVDGQLIRVSDILHQSHTHKGIEAVFDLEISLRENGRQVSVTRNADLENVSSTGLSYLILCSIFAGITRMLCRDDSVKIHWPMDELGTLAAENITKLFVMLDQYNIVMVGGFPTTDPLLLQHFKEHHIVKKDIGITDLVLPEDKLAAIMAEKMRRQNTAEVAG